MTGWERQCIEIFVERKASVFQRNDTSTNLYRVQEMSLLKILWDFNIQKDYVIEHTTPEIIIVDKTDKKA